MAPALPGLSAPPEPPRFSRRGALRLASAVGLAAGAAACSGPDGSAAPALPWPDRPVVTLAFDVATDLRSVSGVETVVFTPDAPVTELVFRAWPNTPAGARAGNALEVTDATVDDRSVVPAVSAGGAPAGAPGTLVVLPVPGGSAPAGQAIHVRLGFRLALGTETGERTGSSPSTSTAWFATAFPLLAWVRGRGWAREPAVDMAGETVTSEEFRLAALTVGTPAGLRVLGTGSDDGPVPAPPGRTARRFHADSVRDVAVAVGDYDLTETRVGPTRVHLGLPAAGTRDDADGWTRSLTRQLDGLTGLLGPYPYPDLWAAIVPTQTDGVEFPTSVQLGDLVGAQRDSLVAHELAHQWFYSLVGNNQAADPWIDESFATFAQALVTGRGDDYRLDDIEPSDRAGRPMGYWAATGGFDRYVHGVYDAGAAALLRARRRAGPERFDAALRGYVATCAHRVVTPADVAAAFAAVPEVIDALRGVGALRTTTPDSAEQGDGNR